MSASKHFSPNSPEFEFELTTHSKLRSYLRIYADGTTHGAARILQTTLCSGGIRSHVELHQTGTFEERSID